MFAKLTLILVAWLACVYTQSANHEQPTRAAVSYRVSDSGVDIHRMERLMEYAFAKSNIDKIQGKDVVLFLGNTQVGKSTLINYLLGVNYEDSDCELSVASGAEYAKRGNGTNSETTHPELYTREGLNYYFCDTQGFSDSKGKEEPIVSSILMEMVINAARSVKIVVPFTEAELEGGAKGIRDFCCVFDQLLSNRDIPILFLYNQKNPRWRLDMVYKKVDGLFDSEHKRLVDLGVESGSMRDVVSRFAKQLFSSRSKTNEESASTESNDSNFKELLGHSSIVDQINKISTLWMLKRMQESKIAVSSINASSEDFITTDVTNLLLVNVLDTGGQGRRVFFNAIDTLSSVRKEYFKFSKLSGHRPSFDEQTCRLLQDFINFLELKRNMDRHNAYVVHRFTHVENYQSYIDFKKLDLQNNLAAGKYPDVTQVLKKLEERERLLTIERDAENMKFDNARREIDKLTKEIAALETPNQPVIFWKDEWKTGWKFFWRYYGAWRAVNYVHEGIPFLKFEEKLGPDTVVEGKSSVNRDEGVFKCTYGTGFKNYCTGTVTIFREKKDLDATKTEVSTKKDKITDEKNKLESASNKLVEHRKEFSKIESERDTRLSNARKGMELDIANMESRIQALEVVKQKLERFMSYRKIVESLDVSRIKTWYLISKNLQSTKSESVVSGISGNFVAEYERRPDKEVSHLIECPITLDSSEQLVRLPCGHIFSQEGYNGMIERNSSFSCPQCRSAFAKNDVRITNPSLCEAQYDDLRLGYLDTLEILSSRFDRMREVNVMFSNL